MTALLVRPVRILMHNACPSKSFLTLKIILKRKKWNQNQKEFLNFKEQFNVKWKHVLWRGESEMKIPCYRYEEVKNYNIYHTRKLSRGKPLTLRQAYFFVVFDERL